MRILLDAHMLGERETGNETYVRGLIHGLHSLPDPFELLIAHAHPGLESVVPQDSRFRWVWLPASSVRRLGGALPALARRERADLLHGTYCLPLALPCAAVVSVHDAAYLRHPEWFTLRDRLILGLGVRWSVRRAAAVLTLSRHAAADIAQGLGVPPDRIHAIPLAADPCFRPADPAPPADPARRPYLLAVGNLQPRKNLGRLVEAFARLRAERGIPHRLVLAGAPRGRESDVHAVVRRCRVEDRVAFAGYVPREELARLYREADVFVYPSLYEGFGLPVLEAMASGTPVVASNTTSIPEVAGDAAILADPTSVEALTEAIAGLLLDPGRRSEQAACGLRRARLFSWTETARRTLGVYAAVLGRRRAPGAAPGRIT